MKSIVFCSCGTCFLRLSCILNQLSNDLGYSYYFSALYSVHTHAFIFDCHISLEMNLLYNIFKKHLFHTVVVNEYVMTYPVFGQADYLSFKKPPQPSSKPLRFPSLKEHLPCRDMGAIRILLRVRESLTQNARKMHGRNQRGAIFFKRSLRLNFK